MTNVSEFPQRALRAEPVQCELLRVGPDGTLDGTTEQVGLVFDCNAIASIEDRWGGLTEWEQALSAKPFTGVRATLAIVLGTTDLEVGRRIMPAEITSYVSRIGAAFAIANGVDPTEAMEMVNDAEAAATAAIADGLAKLKEGSPSTNGSALGSGSDENTPSSGS